MITLARFANSLSAAARRSRWLLPVVLPLFAGLAATAIIYLAVEERQETNLRDEFERDVHALTNALETGIAQHLDTLYTLQSLYNADGEITRETFAALGGDARRRHPGLTALEWIPRVRSADRAAFERATRDAGFPDFSIHPEPQDEDCFPVDFIVPYADNRVAHGYNLASDPLRREALERARDSGGPAATKPIHLVQETGPQFGFLVCLPVYAQGAPHFSVAQRRANLRGFVLAVFRAGDFVRGAAAAVRKDTVDFQVHDLDWMEGATTGNSYTYAQVEAEVPPPWFPGLAGYLLSMQADLTVHDELEVGGRRWLLECRPSLRWLASEMTWVPVGVGSSGLLLTLLTAGWLYTLTGRARRVDQLVSQRTAQLAEASRGLEQQVHDREEAERALKANLDRQIRMNRLWQEELPNAQTLDEKLQHVADATNEAFGAGYCRIWVTAQGDRCTDGCVHRDGWSADAPCQDCGRCLHLRASSGHCAQLDRDAYQRLPLGWRRVGSVVSGQVTKFVSNNIRNDARTQDLAWACELGIVALGEYRLQGTDGTPIGVLALIAKHALTPEEDSLLEGIAASCSHVIQAADAEAQLRLAHDDLEARVRTRTEELAYANQALQAEVAERKQAEEHLRHSDERFRQVAESAGEWIWEVDANGRFTYASPIVEKILGYKPEEIVGRMCLSDLVAAQSREALKSAVLDAFAEHKPLSSLVYAHQHRNGASVMLETNGIPLTSSAGEVLGYCGTATDITERLRTEEESLIFSRQQSTVDDLLHIGLDDVPLADVLQRCLDELLFNSCLNIVPRGAVMLVEEGAATLAMVAHTGVPAALVESCSSVPFGGCLCGRAAETSLTQFASDGRDDHERCAAEMGPYGRYCVPIRSGEGVLGVLVTCVEAGHERSAAEEDFLETVARTLAAIIQRKRIEERLRESEARHRAITEAAQDAIITSDAHGTIHFWNPAAQRIFGYSAAEAVGQNLVELLVPARHRSTALAGLDGPSSAADGVVAGDTFELCGLRADHSEVAIQISLSSYPDHGGRVTVALVHDITERRRAETELEDANRKLVDASRRAGMADVAAGVLHNVGNVLNSTNVSAQLVAERVRRLQVANLAKVAPLMQAASEASAATDDQKRAQLATYLARLAEHLVEEQGAILQELQALTTSIEHIKNVVGMQQAYAGAGGVIELFPLDTAIDDALRMSAGSFEQLGIRILREQDAPVELMTDRQKLLQVLVNLLRNAKHSLQESAVPDKYIALRVTQPDADHLRIAVVDNGLGVAPEHRARLFSFGFTTKKDGHGFGLHSSALAIKEVGGSLTAHSDGPGRGATFTIELPVAPARTNNAVED